MAPTAKRLQIDEDLSHQRREWRLERMGWAVMAVLLAAALLGLLGDGPMGRVRADGPGASLEYDRLQRAAAPTEYRFAIDPALAVDGRVRLRFDETLLEEVELLSIVPEPEAVATGPGYVEYAFAVHGPGARAPVSFRFQPTTFGRVSGRVTPVGGQPLALDQFVYP